MRVTLLARTQADDVHTLIAEEVHYLTYSEHGHAALRIANVRRITHGAKLVAEVTLAEQVRPFRNTVVHTGKDLECQAT